MVMPLLLLVWAAAVGSTPSPRTIIVLGPRPRMMARSQSAPLGMAMAPQMMMAPPATQPEIHYHNDEHHHHHHDEHLHDDDHHHSHDDLHNHGDDHHHDHDDFHDHHDEHGHDHEDKHEHANHHSHDHTDDHYHHDHHGHENHGTSNHGHQDYHHHAAPLFPAQTQRQQQRRMARNTRGFEDFGRGLSAYAFGSDRFREAMSLPHRNLNNGNYEVSSEVPAYPKSPFNDPHIPHFLRNSPCINPYQ